MKQLEKKYKGIIIPLGNNGFPLSAKKEKSKQKCVNILYKLTINILRDKESIFLPLHHCVFFTH